MKPCQKIKIASLLFIFLISSSALGLPEELKFSEHELAVQVHDNGVLEKDDWDGKKKRVAFYAPEITSLRVDGSAKRPGQPVSREFRMLELEGPGFAIKVNSAGSVNISDRTVSVFLINS
jgi:hypothetical protein